MKMTKEQYVSEIAKKYAEVLKDFKGSWQSPFLRFSVANPLTKRRYSGSNLLLLSLVAAKRGSMYFATYKQWQQLGCQVKKGAKGYNTITAKRFKKTVEKKDKETGEIKKEDIVRTVFDWGTVVFNAKDVEGFTEPKQEIPLTLESTEGIDKFYKKIHGDNITREKGRAYYSPLADKINIPMADQFSDIVEYFSTYAHETVHWTVSTKRLNRESFRGPTVFGDTQYSFEEAVADIGAAMFSGLYGYKYMFCKNNLAYLKGWLDYVSDKDLLDTLIKAASKAQKACDYIQAIVEDKPQITEVTVK